MGEASGDARASGQQASGPGRMLAFVGFSLAMAILLLVICDVLVRLAGLDQPQLSTSLMPEFGEEFSKVHHNDDLLFYSLKPGVREQFGGALVSTNSNGFRSPEFGEKEAGEFRILSLGESSTFGAGVRDHETYSFLLEEHLSRLNRAPRYRVINAGVSAYSSFQSRVFLEERALALEPDLVLIYHELADFLPTSNRDLHAPDGVGLPLSDKQLFESKRQTLNRWLLEVSAIYRLLSHSLTQRRVESYQTEGTTQQAEHIVLPNLREISTPEGMRALKLPTRVPLDEREENLNRMLAFCEAHDIQLVIIHPSYAQSKRHECDLTEFAERTGVPIFEAYDSLHAEELPAGALYGDLWHPNAAGHARVANKLFRFLTDHQLVP